MKHLVYICILSLVATSAFASSPINEEADMRADGRLDVSNVAGSVEITGWSRNKIEVTGELGDDSKLVFNVSGNKATVEVEFDDDRGRWGKHRHRESTDLVIRVPRSTRVLASTVSADLTVSEIRGSQRLQTVSGDLETEVYDQEAVIKSVSGEVDVEGNGSRIQIMMASVSGDVDAENIAGEITAKTVSGDIDLSAGEFSQLRVDTVSGDVDFKGAFDSGGRIDAESVSGDILLELNTLYNTEYFLESFSGDIRPILGYKAKKTSRYAPGSKLELTEGDGDSRIRVETMSGDIDITGSDNPRGKPDVRQTSKLRSNPSRHEDFEKHMESLVEEMAELAVAMQELADED